MHMYSMTWNYYIYILVLIGPGYLNALVTVLEMLIAAGGGGEKNKKNKKQKN